MPRTCTVCSSAGREGIDRALIAGEPLRTIADRWSVSKTALIRHKGVICPPRSQRPRTPRRLLRRTIYSPRSATYRLAR